MNSVTILAVWSIGVPTLERSSVDALFIFLWALAHRRPHDVPLIVTLETVNLLGASLMGDDRHVGVTIDTELLFMHRRFELLVVNIERLKLSRGDFAFYVRVSVAFKQASGVGIALAVGRPADQHYTCYAESSDPSHSKPFSLRRLYSNGCSS